LWKPEAIVVSQVGTGIPACPLPHEGAVKYMDAMHKKTAIGALFSFEDSDPPPDP